MFEQISSIVADAELASAIGWYIRGVQDATGAEADYSVVPGPTPGYFRVCIGSRSIGFWNDGGEGPCTGVLQ